MKRPSELARIAAFTRPFRGGPAAGVVAGPGDDCALLRPSPGRLLVAKVDEVVEGVHFGPAFRPAEIGHKALAVALSDLAAAGATPRFCLVAIGCAPDEARLPGIARGMATLAARHGVALVGGNFTRTAALSLGVTALGEVRPAHALRRRGARAGDLLCVTGALGLAALGLRRLARGRPARLGPAERAQLTPTPRVEFGRRLAGNARASIDLSDGLLHDLGQLCKRSGVGAELALEALPIPAAVRAAPDGLALALAGGEDYELLLAVAPARLAALQRIAQETGTPLTVIGRITRGRRLRLRGGEALPAALLVGWDPYR